MNVVSGEPILAYEVSSVLQVSIDPPKTNRCLFSDLDFKALEMTVRSRLGGTYTAQISGT